MSSEPPESGTGRRWPNLFVNWFATEDEALGGEREDAIISPSSLVKHLGKWGLGSGDAPEIEDADDANDGNRVFRPTTANQPVEDSDTWVGLNLRRDENNAAQIAVETAGEDGPGIKLRQFIDGVWSDWFKLHHEGNLDPDQFGVEISGRRRPVEQTIDASTLNQFGNMTGGGGLAAAHDGDFEKTAAQGASAAVPATVGFELEKAQPFVGCIVYGPTNSGLVDSASATVTIRVYGASDEDKAGTDGTILGSRTLTSSPSDGTHAKGVRIETNGNTTSYKYLWVEISSSSSVTAQLAQVKFVKAVLSPPVHTRLGNHLQLVTDVVPSVKGVPFTLDGQTNERDHWVDIIDGINTGDLSALAIPGGTSLISGGALPTITRNFWRLEGVSAERTIIKKTGTNNANVFVIGDDTTGGSRWRMKGIHFDFSDLTDQPAGVAIRLQQGSRWTMEDLRFTQCSTGIQLGSRSLETIATQGSIIRPQILLWGASGGAGIDDQGSNNIKVDGHFITAQGDGTNHNCTGIRMRPGAGLGGDAWKVSNGEINLTNANTGYALDIDCGENHIGNREFTNCVFDRAELASVRCIIRANASPQSNRNCAAIFANCIFDAGNTAGSTPPAFLLQNNQSDGSGIYLNISNCQLTVRNGTMVQFSGSGPIQVSIKGNQFFERGQNPSEAVISGVASNVFGVISGNYVRGGINASGTTVQPTYFISGSSAPKLIVGSNDVTECSGGLIKPGTKVRIAGTENIIEASVSTGSTAFAPEGYTLPDGGEDVALSVDFSTPTTIVISGVDHGFRGRKVRLYNKSGAGSDDAGLVIVVAQSNAADSEDIIRTADRKPRFLMPRHSLQLVHGLEGDAVWSGVSPARWTDCFDWFSHFHAIDLPTSASGTGAAVTKGSYLASTGTSSPFGIASLATGTDTNGSAEIGEMTSFIQPGLGSAMFLTRVAVETLSDETNTYHVAAGFMDAAQAGHLPTNGVFWEINGNDPEHWRISTASNTTRTRVVTAIDVTAGYIWLGIFVNGDWTRADYFYSTDGQTWAVAGSNTTNLPETNETIGFGTRIRKAAGTTSRNLHVDFMGYAYQALMM